MLESSCIEKKPPLSTLSILNLTYLHFKSNIKPFNGTRSYSFSIVVGFGIIKNGNVIYKSTPTEIGNS